ncbi:STAS/SEC14 domain-containing protein [candidate division WOR-3 bacterium]|nr:STAS/SEC14 domain-containing protein [candidate division WOR-3 bacterium]
MGEGMTKMAIITTHRAVRMMGKIVAGIMDRGDDTKFFKTEHEARAWLKKAAPVRSGLEKE